MTQKKVLKEIKHTFKMIRLHTKSLEVLHELALLKKDLNQVQFKEKIKEYLGDNDDAELVISMIEERIEWEQKKTT